MTAFDEEADAIPALVIEEFGSDKARPRVVKTYTPRWGLRKFKPPAMFTNGTVWRLREGGVLEVELRWRQLRRYVFLSPGLRFISLGGSIIQAAEATLPARESGGEQGTTP